MKVHRLYTVLFCSLLFPAVSCVKEEPVIIQEDSLRRVPVSLKLSVDALQDGTPETKTILEPDNGVSSDNQIANFVILQFNGITSSAMPVGGQIYFDHYPLTGSETVTLVASDSPNTVVVLANTFDNVPITSSTTLGQFLEQDFNTISSLAGVFTTSGGDDYLRMSGSVGMDAITAGSSVDVSLKRNVAKIVVNVTNNTSENTGDDAVTISQVQLNGINAKYYYLTHIGTGIGPSVTFSDPYQEINPRRFNNVLETFPKDGSTQYVTQTYTYYIPANLRGATTNIPQYSKGEGAPAGATFFTIFAQYGSQHTPVNYTYYLGGNLTNDFNILPNYKYTYNITINSKGDSHYDYRIDDMAEVKFSVDANCYMLQPPIADGMSRIYAIPVRRAAVFWNESTDPWPGTYGARNKTGYTAYKLDGSTNWTAEVLWSDFDLSGYTGDNAFLQTASGTGFDPTMPSHTAPHFKVKVSSGMQGNVVVGIKVDGVLLWSWHLWITDYNPDRYAVVDGHKYIYPVTGGSIQRMTGTIWTTTADDSTIGYANGFMMDRHLGAVGVTPQPAGKSNGLLYQYGRKDPFSDQNNFYLDGTNYAPVIGGSSDKTIPIAYASSTIDEKAHTRYSVMHPTVLFTGGRWTSPEDDLASGGMWHDSKFWDHTVDAQQLEPKKSIFDPCPPGWKITHTNAWPSKSYENAGNTEAQTYTAVWVTGQGQNYYPEGYCNRETTGALFFYADGSRVGYSGGARNFTNAYIFLWVLANQPASASRGTPYVMNNTNPGYRDGGDWAYRPNGENIRCVRE